MGASSLSQGRLFFVAEPLIEFRSEWRYLDTGADLRGTWRAPAFDDRLWQIGPAQLGFGDGDEATVLNSLDRNNRPIITYYFRKRFTLANEGIHYATLTLLCDDAAVAYVNGQEVYRFNLPPPPENITSATPALRNRNNPPFGGHEEAIDTFAVPPGVLTSGTNVLAVEIHQAAVSPPSQFDISFDLALSAFSYNPGALLTIETESSKAIVRWPDHLSDWQLQESPDLQNWTDVPDTASIVGGYFTFISPLGPRAFFRLRQMTP